ncbi:MAG: hypothetical protein II820_02450 [Ruminiclostridium sp.]|nr:hypothetical protein [Ruminiclostridium sp.]
MEKIKRGSFAMLLYREYYIGRKSIITGFFLFIAVAVFCLLMLLSFDHGNIGKIIDFAIGNPVDDEAKELAAERVAQMRESITFMMKMLPAVMGCQFQFVMGEVAGRDELASWQRFAKCAPVSPARRALAKTVMNIICCCVSMILGPTYANIVGAVTGTGVTYSDISFMLTAITAVTAFTVLAQIFTMILHSMEKGILALLATIMVPAWTAALINGMNRNGAPDDELFDKFSAFCEFICPFLPLILIGLFAFGFVTIYLLYKRREK